MAQRDYQELSGQIRAICDGETDAIAIMATISCALYNAFDGFDWVGFYRVTGPEMLTIGPYQGGHGCLTIPFSRGVCGAAARTKTTQLVPDVHAFEGHIACSSSTLSELVIPVTNGKGTLLGVLDIDSDTADFFTQDDIKALAPLLDEVFSNIP